MKTTDEQIDLAFQALATESPQGAPAGLGASLMGSFRQHHVIRRRRRLIGTALCVVAFIGVGLLVSRSWLARNAPNNRVLVARQPETALPVPEPTNEKAALPSNPQRPNIVARTSKPVRKSEAKTVPRNSFTSLASYSPAFSPDGFKIIRVGLTNADLIQMGAPSHLHSSSQPVLTDVMLDRDGIPIAVRTAGR